MFVDSHPPPGPELNAFVQQLADRLPAHQKTLGLTAVDIEALKANAHTLKYLLSLHTPVPPVGEAFEQGNEMHRGKNGSIPAPPAGIELSTALFIEGGIFTWLDALIHKIRRAEGYTVEIGHDLGLVVTTREMLFEYDGP